mmetsp:Transcript_4063/g.9027  ORF Transcript_4063/g.9027 Transcript_4063/m.9027 type:complete len:270 (-) Transcript_4063:148-957(-)
MAMSFGQTFIKEAQGDHTGTIIMLHGLGDTGEGWVDIMASELPPAGIKVICPTAPTIPVTLNGGMPMPAWFDIPNVAELFTKIDWDRVNASVAHVKELIDAEIAAGIPSERIVMGGFSMGGCLAMRVCWALDVKLAGCLCLSTFVGPAPEKVSDASKGLKMLFCHGQADPLVPAMMGKMGFSSMEGLGMKAEWKEYPGLGHSTDPTELRDIKGWLATTLPAAPKEKPTAEAVQKMSVKQLKSFIQECGADHSKCVEKSELVALAMECLK